MNPARVRHIALALCILNTSLAAAQFQPAPQTRPAYLRQLQGADIPMGEATSMFYQSLAGTSSSGDSTGATVQAMRQAQLQRQLQADDTKFQALLAHMRSALAEARSYELGQVKNLCARRQELMTIPKLAAALNERERQRNARMELLTQGVESIIGVDGKARLDAAIKEQRRGTVVGHMDYEAAMTAEKREPAEWFASACSDSP